MLEERCYNNDNDKYDGGYKGEVTTITNRKTLWKL